MKKYILILTVLFQNFVLSQNNFDNFLNDVVQQSIHDSEIMLKVICHHLDLLLDLA